MAILPILRYGDERLRVKCKRVPRLDKTVRALVDDMLETMRDAHGVGLAAPQVGVPIRLFVAEVPADTEDDPFAGQTFVLFNPELIKASDEYFPEEGCLSIPGWVANVKRFEHVTVKGRDRTWKEVRIKASGLLAHACQHELEHLDGVLFVDHVRPEDLRPTTPATPQAEQEPVATSV
jgi:peptide deformylase